MPVLERTIADVAQASQTSKCTSLPIFPPLLPQNNCKLTILTFLTHLPAQPCPTASYEKLKTNRPNYFGRGVGVGGQTWQDLLHLFFEGPAVGTRNLG